MKMSLSIFFRTKNSSGIMAKTYAEYKRHEPEETILYKILEEITKAYTEGGYFEFPNVFSSQFIL